MGTLEGTANGDTGYLGVPQVDQVSPHEDLGYHQ